MKGSRADAAIEPPHQRQDRTELAKGKRGDEGQRVHAADVGLAVRDVHRAPESARSDGRRDAARGMRCGVAAAMDRAEAKKDGGSDDGDCAQHHSQDAAAAGALEFAEEHTSPQQAEQGICVPQRKCDGEADVPDGEDGERIGNGPKRPGEQCPHDEMFLLGKIADDVAGAFEQSGKGPARGEDTCHHPQRNGEW